MAEAAAEVARLPELAIDGELVMLDAEGRPQFVKLVRRSRLRTTREIAPSSAATTYARDRAKDSKPS